jgi:uncharacterized membrane protein YhiD involved in acid resistance
MSTRRAPLRGWLSFGVLLFLTCAPAAVQASQGQPPTTSTTTDQLKDDNDQTSSKRGKGYIDAQTEVLEALVRLPLATALGAALALRPRRRGTPKRDPAVIQTQIILAIVGALVMMVVGTNLARAFGVVGAAGLVRYRAKIADPKDAVVMLATLATGLGAGVGLYAMAAFSAGFLLLALWVIESFEPHGRLPFDLKIKMGKDTDDRREAFEAVLRRYHVEFDLRSSSDEEVCYDARVPLEVRRERITNAILKLDPGGHGAVEWSERKPKAT